MANNKVQLSNGTVLLDITPTTATASDVASGEVFFTADGTQTTGSLSFVTYYTGSSAPSSSLGNNGDIYLQT